MGIAFQKLTAQTLIECPASAAHVGFPTGTTFPVVLPTLPIDFDSRIHKHINYKALDANLRLTFDFGDLHHFGEESFLVDLGLTVNPYFQNSIMPLVYQVSAPFPINTTLSLNDKEPEIVKLINLPMPPSAFGSGTDPYGLDGFNPTVTSIYSVDIVITNISVTVSNTGLTPVTPAQITAIEQNLRNSLRVYTCYEIDYIVDTKEFTIPKPNINNIAAVQIGNSKQFDFRWNTEGVRFPAWEMQVVQLENLSNTPSVNYEDVTVPALDWSKALLLEIPTESITMVNATTASFPLTLAEGTGYYAWRVRPIGNYYEGGRANNLNWGEWTTVSPSTNIHFTSQNQVAGLPGFIYFEDPDQNKNWIYSRTFTENAKIYEGINYADGLLYSKQSQSYIPSNPNLPTVVTGAMYDHLGRHAISTLPVPTTGRLEGYKEKFIQNAGGNLYTLNDYESSTTINQPNPIKDVGTAFSYYSNNNAVNNNVDNAQGYPFTRTIYSNDGLGFVKEQSGVGKKHMIGDKAQGLGFTTKTEMANVTETELLRIFGDEAPDYTKVTKQTIIDPNGTQAISYLSQTGKPLATCLVYNDTDNDPANDLLNALPSESTTGFNVEMPLSQNIKTAEGFESTTRVYLANNPTSTLIIEYDAGTCSPITVCGQPVNCDFTIEFAVYRADDTDNNLVPVNQRQFTLSVLCAQGTQLMIPISLPPGSYVVKKVLKPVNSSALNQAIANTINQLKSELEAYGYLIEDLTKQVEENDDWLNFFDCMDCVQNFVQNYPAIPVTAVCPTNSLQCCILAAGFDFDDSKSYVNILGNLANPQVVDIDYAPSQAQVPNTEFGKITFIFNNCLNNNNSFEIPVEDNYTASCGPGYGCTAGKYEYQGNCYDYPPFVEYFADVVGQGLLDANYSIPTLFTGYGITNSMIDDYLNNNGSLNDNDFNRMIWHMLNDKYFCGSLVWNSITNTFDVLELDGTTRAINPSADIHTQYSCTDLWQCWQSNIGTIEAIIDAYSRGLISDTDYDVAVDDQQNGNQNVHDDHFTSELPWGIKLFLTLAGFNPIQRLRTNDPDNSVVPLLTLQHDLQFDDLSELFLRCSGPRYAKMINAEVYPVVSNANLLNAANTPTALTNNINLYNSITGSTIPSTGVNAVTLGFNNFDVPLDGSNIGAVTSPPAPYYASNWTEIDAYFHGRQAQPFNTKFLPLSYNPVFAFKYYEYFDEVAGAFNNPYYDFWTAEGATIPSQTQATVAKPVSYNSCELTYCYSYVNAAQVTPFCFADHCTTGHEAWTCGRRGEFYACLKHTNVIPPGSNSLGNNGADCTTEINNLATNNPLLNSCNGACDERRAEFRMALIEALTERCYVVGGCATCPNHVTEADIDAMLNALVADCKNLCNATVTNLGTITCNLPDGTPITFCDIQNGTPCELYFMEQARFWQLDLDLPNVCDPVQFPTGHLQNQYTQNPPSECNGSTTSPTSSPVSAPTSPVRLITIPGGQ